MKTETRRELNKLSALRYDAIDDGKHFYNYIGQLLIAIMKDVNEVRIKQKQLSTNPRMLINPDGSIELLEAMTEYDKQLKKVQDSYHAKREHDLKISFETGKGKINSNEYKHNFKLPNLDRLYDEQLDEANHELNTQLFTCGDCKLHGKRDCPLDVPHAIPSWTHKICESFKCNIFDIEASIAAGRIIEADEYNKDDEFFNTIVAEQGKFGEACGVDDMNKINKSIEQTKRPQ